MSTKLSFKNSKGVVFCTVEYLEKQKVVYANWIGYANEAEPAKRVA